MVHSAYSRSQCSLQRSFSFPNITLQEEITMPGEKAVCVLLPNDSPVKGTIHFEQVSGEFLTFTEDMSVQRAFAIRDFLTCCKLLATVKLKFLLFFKSFETAESMLGGDVSIYREKNAFCVIFSFHAIIYFVSLCI